LDAIVDSVKWRKFRYSIYSYLHLYRISGKMSLNLVAYISQNWQIGRNVDKNCNIELL